ncbi:unnamed protein product [Paramecium octaurelia]|uniref:Uncharacterized protein n=1 Tax=Paramecium octaurelia TaxID=43137 RepID=A0A8S1TLM8_PAROT|nr:unnamed protein product [Paramecium octaurelia]
MSSEQQHQQTKLHKLQNYYHQFEKAEITGTQLKSQLQTNLKNKMESKFRKHHSLSRSIIYRFCSINLQNQQVCTQINNTVID